jgi:hypothetical protein
VAAEAAAEAMAVRDCDDGRVGYVGDRGEKEGHCNDHRRALSLLIHDETAKKEGRRDVRCE